MAANGEIERIVADCKAVIGHGIGSRIFSLHSTPTDVIKEIDTTEFSKEALQALEAELKLLPRPKHPHIVNYTQSLRNERYVYLRMPRYSKSLRELISFHKNYKMMIPRKTILRCLAQIAEAFVFLQNGSGMPIITEENMLQTIYRNVRPENILLDNSNENFFLTDFGVYRDVDDLLGQNKGDVLARASYIAPEILLDRGYTAATDMWSLGVIVYEMVTLEKPDFLSGESPEAVYIDTWEPDLSMCTCHDIRDILANLLVLSSGDRMDAKELLENQILHEYLSEEYVTAFIRPRHLQSQPKASDEHTYGFKYRKLVTEVKVLTKKNAELNTMLREQADEKETLSKDLKAKNDQYNEAIESLTHTKTQFANLESKISNYNSIIAFLQESLYEKEATIKQMRHQLLKIESQPGSTRVSTRISSLNDLAREEMLCDLSAYKFLQALQKEILDMNDGEKNQLRELGASLNDLIGKLCTLTDHISRKRHALAIMLRADESKRGNALIRLLTTMTRDYSGINVIEKDRFAATLENPVYVYNLSIERAALIMFMAERDGATLLEHGYTQGYVDALCGMPTDDTSIQPDGWNSWFRYAEQDNVDGLNSIPHKPRSLLPMAVKAQNSTYQEVTALMIAVCLKNENAVRFLVDKESKMFTENRVTSLMMAAILGYTEMGRILLDYEKGMRDASEQTALMWAIYYKNMPMVDLLFRRENCVHKRDGHTALIVAARVGNTKAAELLSEYETKLQDYDGWTALMYAAQRGYSDIVKILLKHEAGMQGKSGETALMMAAEKGHTEIVNLLLDKEHGLVRQDGWSALMVAVEHGKLECVKILGPYERDLKNNIGKTALMYAREYNHPDISRFLKKCKLVQ